MHDNIFCLVKKLLQLQVQNQNLYGVLHINISVVFSSYTLRKILSKYRILSNQNITTNELNMGIYPPFLYPLKTLGNQAKVF